MKSIKDRLYEHIVNLFPINRSLTGAGVNKTLLYIKNELPELSINEIKSRTQVYDWEVPDVWNIEYAYIEDLDGNKVVNFENSNLHVVGYSEPIDRVVKRDDLEEHLFSLPNQPNAIPYVTSYYQRNWGFCLTQEQKNKLNDDEYRVVIKSSFDIGVMQFADLVIPGESSKEVLLTTYICHPSMASNELSGPSVLIEISKWLYSLKKRQYTYRIVFAPETIGAIVYINRNIRKLKKNVIGGYVLTCLGDDLNYSYVPSRNGLTISDRVAKHVLTHMDKNYRKYTWLDRGSDERQYCAPGVDLPIASIMRSKYGEYSEYHTSLDNLNYVTGSGLYGGFLAYQNAIKCLELNATPVAKVICEPKLSKRGLYPNISIKGGAYDSQILLDIYSYSDGKIDFLEIAEKLNKPLWLISDEIAKLIELEIIEVVK